MELTEKPQSGHEYAETLLAAANKEQRGKLTVFLGAAAGVGKTCSMLQEAHARLREGTDIVLGLVLTHGRKETAALLEGLPRIPEQENIMARCCRKWIWMLFSDAARSW